MKRLLVLLLFMNFAIASTLTLTWEVPTERVNGDPMPIEEISHYELRCSSGNDQLSLTIPSVSDGGIFESGMAELFGAYGVYDCSLAVVDTWGLYSDFVEVENGPIEYLPPAPGVPTNVLILRSN